MSKKIQLKLEVTHQNWTDEQSVTFLTHLRNNALNRRHDNNDVDGLLDDILSLLINTNRLKTLVDLRPDRKTLYCSIRNKKLYKK